MQCWSLRSAGQPTGRHAFISLTRDPRSREFSIQNRRAGRMTGSFLYLLAAGSRFRRAVSCSLVSAPDNVYVWPVLAFDQDTVSIRTVALGATEAAAALPLDAVALSFFSSSALSRLCANAGGVISDSVT